MSVILETYSGINDQKIEWGKLVLDLKRRGEEREGENRKQNGNSPVVNSFIIQDLLGTHHIISKVIIQ